MTLASIGVLALQGDVRAHVRMLETCGARAVPVRRPAELLAVDGLVVPGGESTTMIKLAAAFDLLEPLRKRIADDMPTFGTCAGMILLADRIEDGIAGQETVGGIDMTVRRNAFGRQVDSFEADLALSFEPDQQSAYHAVFIRAPWVESVGPTCQPLARVRRTYAAATSGVPSGDGAIVAVRQGRLLATSFHPELTGDTRIHDYFVRLVKEG